jgi:uncharacterized membrane protein
MEGFYFSNPQLLWGIPILFMAGLIYIVTKAKNKFLAGSRLIIFCLILAAAANPYVVATHTVQSTQPLITILADRTASMSLFDPDVATRLNDVLPNSQVRTFSGESTPLGDKILQYATPGSTLVLVSDGFSNKGRSLDESLALARATNTTVFAIQMDPIITDASVEISGTNTAVAGSDYPFAVIVRSSGNYKGVLSVFAEDQLIYKDSVVTNSTSSIKISHKFFSTGSHVLRAEISSDAQPANNVYQKAVYVVPKPNVLLVSGGPSPLSTVLSGQYKLAQSYNLPQKLQEYKAVVLDDRRASLELASLKGYIRDGGGLVVVGGTDSYELGGYLNSSFEEMLPVKSLPSTFRGGKIVVLVLDISLSMLATRTRDGTSLLDYEKALAIELLKSPDFRDYKVGVVVFGTKAYVVNSPLPLPRGRSVIEDRITSLSPSGSEDTNLDNGLQLARDMLNATQGKGEITVISDGDLRNYEQVFLHSAELIRQMNLTTRLIQVQAFDSGQGRFGELASKTGAQYLAFTYPTSLTTKVQTPPEKKPDEVKPPAGYTISVVNKNHYITSDLDLNATISGFNDVTPKPGAQRLVAMADGKPVLTTWRYGLGRVASLSTDDGAMWAPILYSIPSSKLISATVNWAVGDPRPELNRIDSEDGWVGTLLSVSIQSNTRPTIEQASVEQVGDNRYAVTLSPDKVGILFIGDYGIAVNYPVEYRDVGFNPDLAKKIMANGGRIFSEKEAALSLAEEAMMRSQRTIQDRESRRDLLLLAALAIFLAEVVGRRLKELKLLGRS